MLEEELTYFRTLRASDREAILALLATEQRQKLERLLQPAPAPVSQAPPAKTRIYSRWLRRKLDSILSNTEANVTPAAREALAAILQEARA